MSRKVEINGLTLVPIKEALTVVAYSKDYIARLAREGKIIGSQVGRQWYIDLTSLKNFSEEASAFKSVQKIKLSNDRKRELMANECLSALDEVVLEKARAQRFDALVATCGVVALGLLGGVGLYTTMLLPESKLASLVNSFDVSFATPQPVEVASLAESNNKRPVFRVIDKPQDTLLFTTITERPVFETESEIKSLANLGEGILLLPRNVRSVNNNEMKNDSASGEVASLNERQNEIKNLFSDTSKVTVTYQENNQGIVSYQKDEGTVVQYPFVAVPKSNEEVRDVVLESTVAPLLEGSEADVFKPMEQ